MVGACGLHYISLELAWTLGDDKEPALVNHEFANEHLKVRQQAFPYISITSFKSNVLLLLIACSKKYYITFTILFAALASAVATAQGGGTQCGAA